MICVGIDVAKDKHDCFILSSEGEVLADVFTIPNNRDGFETLLQRIRSCALPADIIKVGLEATGHYSYNILGFLLDCGQPTYVINPLHTNLYRKSLSLRKTKTDRIDARTSQEMNEVIGLQMLLSQVQIENKYAINTLKTFLVSPLRASHVPQSGADQHQGRVTIREASHHTRPAPDLSIQTLDHIVGADPGPML